MWHILRIYVDYWPVVAYYCIQVVVPLAVLCVAAISRNAPYTLRYLHWLLGAVLCVIVIPFLIDRLDARPWFNEHKIKRRVRNFSPSVPWTPTRPRVTAYQVQSKKKKKRQQPDDPFDGTRAYIVRGCGSQKVQPIPLAYGTYTVHYGFAGRRYVNVRLIHARDRYYEPMINRGSRIGTAVFEVPEDGHFIINVHPYKGRYKAWRLEIVPGK